MVNVAGAFRGLGNALSYAGQQGMEEERQQRQRDFITKRDEALAARDEALEKLRRQNRLDDDEIARERNIRDYRTRSDIDAENLDRELRIKEPYAVATEQRAEQRMTRQERREFDMWKAKHSISTDSEKSLQLWKWENDPSRNSDEISEYVEDGNSGTIVGLTKSGKVYDTGVPYRKDKGRGGGGGSILGMAEDGDEEAAPASEQPSTAGLKTGTIIEDDKGRRLRLNENGRWVQIAK